MRNFEIESDNNLFDIFITVDESNEALMDDINESLGYWEDVGNPNDPKNVKIWVLWVADQIIEAMLLDYTETDESTIITNAIRHEALCFLDSYLEDGDVEIRIESNFQEEVFSSTITEW